MDEKTDHTAGCQLIPLPHGGAIVTCPTEVGAVQVDAVNSYLAIGAVIFIVLAIAVGLKLINGNKTNTGKPRKP